MSQMVFTGLALLQIHYNVEIEFKVTANRFVRASSEEIGTANILFD